MFETFEKIKLLAKKQGISLNTLEERVGLGKNYIYSLKNKKTPSVEHIAKIADYFYVHFMERHELKTTADELMVIDEYYRLVG